MGSRCSGSSTREWTVSPMDAQPPPPVEWIENELPEDLRARIKVELAPGERLVWADRAIRAQTKEHTSLMNLALWSLGGFSIFGSFLGYATGLFGTPPRDGADVPIVVGVAVVSGLVGLGTGIGLIAAIVEQIQSWSPSSRADYALTDRVRSCGVLGRAPGPSRCSRFRANRCLDCIASNIPTVREMSSSRRNNATRGIRGVSWG